jgi:hypothetical protein
MQRCCICLTFERGGGVKDIGVVLD